MKGPRGLTAASLGVFLLRAAMSAGAPPTPIPGERPLTYLAPAGPGRIELSLRREGSCLIVLDGGVPAASGDVGTTSSVLIGGPDMVDTSLTVDYSFGSIPVPIDYHPGAGGYNVLTLQGSSVESESHLLTGPQSGVITLDGRPVVYSNLTPVTDTIASPTLTITGTPGFDTINIVDGPVVVVQTTQVNSGAGGTFESYNFANKASVTVDGSGGGDTVSINNPNPAAGWTTLNITGVGLVSQTGPLKVANLAVSSAGSVDLSAPANQVSVVAASVTGAGASFAFRSTVPTLFVGQVGSVTGITTNGGSVILVENVQAGGSLSVKNAISTSGGNVALYADNISFSAAANAGTGTVHLDTEILARPITLGTAPGTSLGLLQADLNEITAGVLRIGDESLDTGGLMLTAPITAPAGAPGTWSTIDLRNSGAIDADLGSGLFVPNVALRSQTDIGASSALGFLVVLSTTVAALNTGGGAVQIYTSGSLAIGTVAGLSGITSVSGILVDAGGLTINGPVNAGGSPVVLVFGGSVSGGTGTVTGSAVTFADTFSTGHNYTLTGTSILQSPSSTPIPISTPNLTVTGGTGEDVFVVTPSATTTFTVNGSDPVPPSTGDSVVIVFGGTTNPCVTFASDPTGTSGAYTFGNRQPVNFTQIETLPANPDVTPPAVSAPSPLAVTQTTCI